MFVIKIKDYIFLSIIILVYSIIAFYNLGDMYAPETMWTGSRNDFIVVEFDEETDISKMQYYLGPAEERKIKISFSDDSITWSGSVQATLNSVFAWGETVLDTKARYIKITAQSETVYLAELAFRNTQNEIITPVKSTAPELFDEQSIVPLKYTNLNSTYFDEIYHARTAYEFLNHLPVYEWTHPPLGKDLIAFGVMLFGMNPFGWRFAGVLAGILMIPLVYVFAKKMFKETYWAVFASIVFTFDFMHFAQTRLATIDSFVTLFIIGMYYYMYKYYIEDDARFTRQLFNLFLSGLFMSLAIAVKWQGIYSAVGLAVLFFIALIKKRMPSEKNAQTLLCCVAFFVLVPVCIYCLSYGWYLKSPYMNGFESIIVNQTGMFNYHYYLESEHPFSSVWWTWPLNIRPIFYYVDAEPARTAAISSFGNPFVWWAGVFATIYAFYALIFKRDKNILFILIAYAAQLLPWALVGRTTYIYHYFPSILFIVLLISYMFKNEIKYKSIRYAYLGLVTAAFIFFYPVISGMYVNPNYINFLKWLPSWQLM